MYIKREPLGQGNLTFRRKKRRLPVLFIILYMLVLGAALYVYLNMERIQPQVLAAIGPEPTATMSEGEVSHLAQEAYQAGNLAEAAEYYRHAAALMPDDVQVLADLARVLTLMNTPDSLAEAVEVADQAILIAPEDPRGYAMKARALNWAGEADQSAIEALRAIELDPDYVLGHAYLAEAYTDLGQLRQAREQAEIAIELDPYNVDARRNYAYVLEFYGDYGGAIAQYQQAIQINPNLLDLWYGLARNYRGAGPNDPTGEMYQKSFETYQQIIMRVPDDPLPYVELGRTYFEVREDDAAQANLERAVALICEDCPLHTYEEIERDGFKRPADEVPDEIYLPAWRRLGMVYHARRNYEDAIAIFEEMIAYGEKTGEDIPLEAYYVSATGYYYLDHAEDGSPLCNIAVPRAMEALDTYERERIDDPNALDNILKVIVLCRDWANTPATIRFSFPADYAEPDVYLERPGSESSGDATDGGEGTDDGAMQAEQGGTSGSEE